MHVQFNVSLSSGKAVSVFTRKMSVLPEVGDVIGFGDSEFSEVTHRGWVLHEDGDPSVLIRSVLCDINGNPI